jgi:cell division transport system permease protein
MLSRLFLNTLTIISIAMAVLIFSAALLFFVHADRLLHIWLADLRIMVYLKKDISEAETGHIREQIQKMPEVAELVFIPKEKALKRFRQQMGKQASLAEGLRENPLPDSFEVRLFLSAGNWNAVAPLAGQIAEMAKVEDVEYGEQWLGKFIHILNLFRMSAYVLGGIFFLAAVFFVANTIRLVLWSRREEIEIMRLFGATESFIKDPFYLQALFMGTAGGVSGLGGLYLILQIISQNTAVYVPQEFFQLRFLPLETALAILAGSMLTGWTGCFFSLRQFLKS